ncbi:hypothetical protein SLEP1_g21332 [Rubroshorea leprosula]|uniref:Uncharacterized protein n=1 Tax=Rubroshorea leprosula TaxID=152421 RepID=A0AAV5JBM4_9ROSI|nr:hypothetical protein SLEP1_g21332 [Rubroshorea leprosula]
MALVSTQKLAGYSTSSTRGKLTLPQHVVGKIGMLFPPELQNEGNAKFNMFLEVPNEGSRPFVVTTSLQKLRKAEEKVERAPEADRIDELDAMDEDVVPEQAPIKMEFDLNEPVQLDMEINLNQPNQPVRMEFDLNELAHPNMESVSAVDLVLPKDKDSNASIERIGAFIDNGLVTGESKELCVVSNAGVYISVDSTNQMDRAMLMGFLISRVDKILPGQWFGGR